MDTENMQSYDDPEYDQEGVEEENPIGTDPATVLRSFIGQSNIVPMLDEEIVSKIGMEVTRGYEIDKSSRAHWEKMTETAMDLAMQKQKEKSWPWQKAANVKFPLITTASIQFSARAYPAIIRGEQIVKGMVIGPDPDGVKEECANRIGQHMSYQLLEQIKGWDEDTDKLLMQISIVGCAFRKTYFDPMLGRNRSDFVPAKYVVYDHQTSFDKLRRITHCFPLFKNEVIERVRGDIFEEVQLGTPSSEDGDEDGHYEFLEQHCWYDLDGDGYKEPYIVTVVKETSEVARIVARFDEDSIYLNQKGEIARIDPIEYWTKFPFMPNPDGGSYDVGLGILLNPINETVNTVLNQLLDAGTLANTGGGFIGRGLNLKGGAMRFAPGEYKPVDVTSGKIADSVYHMQFSGPSPVLFQLLGLLIEAGRDISSVKDILTGEQQGANTPATTTLALIEQGQKVFSAIYKRVHRSLKEEFAKLFLLNKNYLNPEEYYQFQGKSSPIYLEDYQQVYAVAPVSDPNLATDTQELARTEALMQFKGDPFFNQYELRKRFLLAIKDPNPDAILVKEPPPPPPDPKMIEIQAKMSAMEVEVNSKAEKIMAEIENMRAKNADLEASATLKLAQAEAVVGEPQMRLLMMQVQALLDSHLQQMKSAVQSQPPQGEANNASNEGNDQGGLPAMGGASADAGVPPVSEGLPPGANGEMGYGDTADGESGMPDGGGALPNG